jgi:tetratricopeptide (TPR) repeat protein
MLNELRTALILLLVGALIGTGLRADVKPAAPDPRTAAALIKQGQDAFAAEDFNQARDSFADALQADPNNVTAAKDLGITYLRLEKPAKATHPLEMAAASKNMDRALVLAFAYERINAKSPMQAAKAVMNYFEAHPTPVDEPLLNALGISLSQANALNIKSSLVTDAAKVYKKLNTKLEATRAGEKRWGPEWQPAADVDQKQSATTAAQTAVRNGTATVNKLTSQIASLQAQKDAVLYTEGNNNQTQKKDAFQKQIDQATTEQSKAQQTVDEASKTLTDLAPKWPDNIPLEQLTLGAPAGTVVAVTPPSNGASPTATPANVTPANATPANATPAAVPPSTVTPPPDTATDPTSPKASSYHGSRYAAAFAVAPDLLVTASSVVTDSTNIQIQVAPDHPQKAEIVRADAASGLTLLRVTDAHFAPLPLAATVRPGAIKCGAFPDVSIFTPQV